MSRGGPPSVQKGRRGCRAGPVRVLYLPPEAPDHGGEDISQALPKKAERSKCNSSQSPPVTFADVEGGDAPGLRLHGFLSPPSLPPALPSMPCWVPTPRPACRVHRSPRPRHRVHPVLPEGPANTAPFTAAGEQSGGIVGLWQTAALASLAPSPSRWPGSALQPPTSEPPPPGSILARLPLQPGARAGAEPNSKTQQWILSQVGGPGVGTTSPSGCVAPVFVENG